MRSDKGKEKEKLLFYLSKFENIPDKISLNRSQKFFFHLSKHIREKTDFDKSLFSKCGNIIFADFKQVKEFCQKINNDPDSLINVSAGNINAMGLVDEIFHHIFYLYRKNIDQNILNKAYNIASEKTGKSVFEKFIKEFITEFPPEEIYNGTTSPDEYLQKLNENTINKNSIIEEIILIWIASKNPAYSSYSNLFFSKILEKDNVYENIIMELGLIFKSSPGFGPESQDILSLLMSPSRSVPDSLSGQLKFIKEHWGLIIKDFEKRMLLGIDLLSEEKKFRGTSPGPSQVLEFSPEEMNDYENFSDDSNWMENLVLMVKSTFVWLDQLSDKYNRNINRLDQIPLEELELLSERGFSGIWLIGIWERSKASKTIKQKTGNPEAISSAYSIYEYTISEELGGEEAFRIFKKNTEIAGLKITADMVPNHMGIDSPWVVNNPQWFISTDNCPFPSYTFTGPDLSDDHNKGIYLEDHYFDKSDAAVVFKWVNKKDGKVKYIYHGNDGTSMPWNDTAQLNYLHKEARDFVKTKIMEIASRFNIIRFDAAMTLTQKHFQRLWFPQPGSGGDIPTRSEYGLTRSEFIKLFPNEFWIDVVDSIKRERPDTLLVAEAFWLMEPYFVRTLGMHRVYNSSFMNFLKNEENMEFRTSIKNTLIYNPQILKRFVNFMSNPDEDTAISQFGKDDKYFGVCTILVTLPGLPLFGHGQIEGFTEKYGMEYKKAYFNENPDSELLERHRREIFPLLKIREIFSNVENFRMYDLLDDSGKINENVIIYSNFFRNKFSLIIYNNKYAFASGNIKNSVPFLKADLTPDKKTVRTESIGKSLKIEESTGRFITFYDSSSKLTYIRSCDEIIEKGLYFELEAFKYHVLLEFKQIPDLYDKRFFRLNRFLNGQGCLDLFETMKKEILSPLKNSFKDIIKTLLKTPCPDKEYLMREFIPLFTDLIINIQNVLNIKIDHKKYSENIIDKIGETFIFHKSLKNKNSIHSADIKAISTLKKLSANNKINTILPVFLFISEMGNIQSEGKEYLHGYFDEWFVWEKIEDILTDPGVLNYESENLSLLIKVLYRLRSLFNLPEKENTTFFIEEFFGSADVKKLLGVNHFKEVNWFVGEKMSELLEFTLYIHAVYPDIKKSKGQGIQLKDFDNIFKRFLIFSKNAELSGYDFDELKRITLGSISG
ncbi:MAG: alpha-amylase family glycosyl hydrolase [Acidobacteriota bacterium]